MSEQFLIRKELMNPNLSRPDWVHDNSRVKQKLWLDKNESIDPSLNKIVSRIIKNIPIEACYSYPDLDKLYLKISKLINLSPYNLLLSAGSDGAIRACFEACISPGSIVMMSRPTFAMYEIYAKIYGAIPCWLDYESSTNGPYLECDYIVGEIKRNKPKMVCLANPDSPTGTIFKPHDIEKIIIAAKKVDALMLIDEAYYPFYKWTAAPLIDKYDNLVIIRSFSKAWGAAGLRVGYAIACKGLIEKIHKQRPMYEIGCVSAKAIEMLLDHKHEMEQSVKRIQNGMAYFQNSMKKLGFDTFESYGNFFHINFSGYADLIHEELEDKAYYRKIFNVDCLKGFSRFSGATKHQYKPLIESIEDIVIKSRKK
jgi:histidinol-phosphate aminotransferase